MVLFQYLRDFCCLLQKLTGGVLLCRNKDYIVFYRGKDFLAPELTEALLERERLVRDLQDKEEQARMNASSLIFDNTHIVEYGDTGTLKETQEANARWGKQLDDNDKDKMLKAADVKRHTDLVRRLERKFFIVSLLSFLHAEFLILLRYCLLRN